jgi:hypothetical protein
MWPAKRLLGRAHTSVSVNTAALTHSRIEKEKEASKGARARRAPVAEREDVVGAVSLTGQHLQEDTQAITQERTFEHAPGRRGARGE